MAHPKTIEIGATYSPSEWEFEKSYYLIKRNQFGYWATHYVTHDPSKPKEYWYAVAVNDKIAKSFTHLCKKVDQLIEYRSAKTA